MQFLPQPVAASACETNWKNWDFIVDPYRNRLTPERQNDLVYVFSNLRLLEKIVDGVTVKNHFLSTKGIGEDSDHDEEDEQEPGSDQEIELSEGEEEEEEEEDDGMIEPDELGLAEGEDEGFAGPSAAASGQRKKAKKTDEFEEITHLVEVLGNRAATSRKVVAPARFRWNQVPLK